MYYTVRLDKRRAIPYLVDRVAYLKEYDMPRKYRLLQNAPLIINIDGLVVKVNDIPKLLVNSRDNALIAEWLNDCFTGQATLDEEGHKKPNVRFIWK